MKVQVECTGRFLRKHYHAITNSHYALIINVNIQDHPEAKDHFWVKWSSLWDNWYNNNKNLKRIKARGCLLKLKGHLIEYPQEYAKGKFNLVARQITEVKPPKPQPLNNQNYGKRRRRRRKQVNV
jgi:arginine decarboxylase-like protein